MAVASYLRGFKHFCLTSHIVVFPLTEPRLLGERPVTAVAAELPPAGGGVVAQERRLVQ